MSPARTAWLVVVLLMPVAMLNYLDRQLLTVMKASVMRDLPSIETDANWGLALGLFKWVYAAFSPFGGYVADRVGRRVTVCSSLFVWSTVTLLTGRVSDFHELIAARCLMGFSEAFYIPAALALIADYHTGSTRSRAVGLHQWAIYLGQIVGGFGGYLADAPTVGWRGAFIGCGVFGMLYAVPLFLVLRDVPKEDDAGSGDDPLRPVSALLTNRFFLLLVLYFTLPAIAGWIVRDWMPAILQKRFDLSQGDAGVAATLPWQVAAICGALAGGWLADRWSRSRPRGRMYASALGTALIAPAVIGTGHAESLAVAVVFLVLFGLGWGVYDCNHMPILAQIVRPRLRATGFGVMNLVSIGCGGLVVWGFGILRVRNVSESLIFDVMGVVTILSVGLVLLIRPKDQR